MKYEVAYTPADSLCPEGTDREYEDYRNKKTAISRALKLLKEGCRNIFVDTFDNDGDTIDFINISNGDIVFIQNLL